MLTSVDYSPGQNYLLELELAAMRELDYDTLLAFFGVDRADGAERYRVFQRLRGRSPAARAYFTRHQSKSPSMS